MILRLLVLTQYQRQTGRRTDKQVVTPRIASRMAERDKNQIC